MSKGDAARPFSVTLAQFDARHEAVFGKPQPRQQWKYQAPQEFPGIDIDAIHRKPTGGTDET